VCWSSGDIHSQTFGEPKWQVLPDTSGREVGRGHVSKSWPPSSKQNRVRRVFQIFTKCRNKLFPFFVVWNCDNTVTHIEKSLSKFSDWSSLGFRSAEPRCRDVSVLSVTHLSDLGATVTSAEVAGSVFRFFPVRCPTGSAVTFKFSPNGRCHRK
jgi:hypothetical protein